MNDSVNYRLYHDLAEWWPLISPPERYADEAAYLANVIGGGTLPGATVLDLGSGGGHIAFHLKRRFAMTLVDVSPQMLDVSRRLTPECEHVLGDMRTIRLGRTFDAVLVHDAIDYITTTADLRLVIDTAFTHTRPGGMALFVPDYVKDDFQPGTAGGGTGGQASFRVTTYDPDPADDWIAADYEFTLRRRIVRETHHLGAFARATWISGLERAGFTTVDQPGHLFLGRRRT